MNSLPSSSARPHLTRRLLSSFTWTALALAVAHGQAPKNASIPVVFTITAPEGEKTGGGLMHVNVSVLENPSRIPAVATSVSKPGVRNETWQASAWMAAFAAARETEHQMLEYQYSVIAPDVVDGPSAGMVLSASMLALINGVSVLPDRAMTGTVNPDGTTGPVGGISIKMEAAQRAGMKKFGFPVGQRLEYSKNEGRYIDLMMRARQLGMEGVEIRDINDAYQLLTDQKTGNEVMTVASTPPAMSQGAADRIRASFLRASDDYKSLFDATVAKFPNIPRPTFRDEEMQQSLDDAQSFKMRALISYDAGSAPVAYLHMLNAIAMCESVDYEMQVLSRAMLKGAASDRINAGVDKLIEISNSVKRARESLEVTIQSNLMAQILTPRLEALNAHINLREGFALEQAASRLVITAIQQYQNTKTKSGALPNGFYECVAKACLYFAQAKTRFQTSQDFYSMLTARAANEDVALRLAPDFEQSLGNVFTQGAQSSLVFIDVTTRDKWRNDVKKNIVERKIADGFQPDFEFRAESISLVDSSYLPNQQAAMYDQKSPERDRSAIELLSGRQWKFQSPSTNGLDAFGSGAASYLGLSSIILQYYNYSGSKSFMAHSRSYGTFIDIARAKAIDAAGRLEAQMIKEIGSPPTAGSNGSLLPAAVLLNLELADSLRYGNDDDRVLCLKVYWRVSLLCDLAMDMIRKSKN